MRSNRTARIGQTILFAILLLFFLQVLTDFIQSIYAFGLLVTAFTIQLAAVLLLFTPLILLLLREAPTRPWIVGTACLAMLGRLLEPILDPGGRLVACGISVGAFMLLFPMLLASAAPGSIAGWRLGAGLLMGTLSAIFLRTVNSSLDLSEYGIYQFVAWALAVLAGRLIWDWQLSIEPLNREERQATARTSAESSTALSHEARREESLRALHESLQSTSREDMVAPVREHGRPGSSGRVTGLCIGIASVILMLYFGLASPAVIARWTGYSFLAILCVLVVALAAFAMLFGSSRAAGMFNRRLVLVWNGLFVLMLVLTILPHEVSFPRSPDAYPLDVSAPSPLAMVPLFVMLLLSPVLFADFMLYARQLSADGPSIRQLGAGFALAALFVLVMVFLHVFTTIYDYAAPVGPLFRDRFWLVYLIAGLTLALPMLLIRDETFRLGTPDPALRPLPAATAVLALLSIAAAVLTAPRPSANPGPVSGLRVMTYNIQQGFDKVGDADLPGQLAAIKHVRPDLLGLEESDTARIANGNVDAVRFFADKLDMYSYYGPTTTTGTFGIALLSRYPIQKPRTFFMYSSGEQTAAIEAEITVNGKTYYVFVTHLGNGGPMIQLKQVLQRIVDLPDVILMGDFNFDPSTPQYALAAASFADAWKLRWPSGYQYSGPGSGSEQRIDLIWVRRGTQVLDAQYVPDPSSDHPYLYAVLKP